MDSFRLDSGSIGQSYTTPDGWQRVYLRLARADHDYKYFNADGSQRIERISPDELFRKDSADTAKMIPIGIGHPASVRVDSDNVGGWMTGSTGHSVIRETTADGEFLGITATIFDRRTQEALENAPGISPGYATKLARTDSQDYFDQTNRVYNHTAAAVIPRGGNEVRALFEGMRVDSLSGSDLWIMERDDSIYSVPINTDQVVPLLERGDGVEGLATRTTVNLDMYKVEEEGDDDGDTEDSGEKPMTEGRKKRPKAKRRKATPKGFGQQPAPEPNKYKRNDMVDLTIGDITYPDVPDNLASAVTGLLARVDEATTELNEASEALGLFQSRVDELEEELETRADSEPDMERTLQIARNIGATVDQMRADGQLLVDLGVINTFNTDFAYIVGNMKELQGEMAVAVSPSLADRVDEFDDAETAIAYETAIGSARSIVERNDSAEGEDRQDMDMGYGSMTYKRAVKKKKPMGDKHLTLTGVAKATKPKDIQSNAGAALRKYAAMDDEAYEEAGKTLQHQMNMAGTGARLM